MNKECSEKILSIYKNPLFYGRMNDPVSAAYVKGSCGDEMEIYLDVKNDKIIDIKFYTDDCISSIVCGDTVCALVLNKTIIDSLNLSPMDIINELEDLTENQYHCAILACAALHKAVSEYMLTV